jgi:hypothetical protein
MKTKANLLVWSALLILLAYSCGRSCADLPKTFKNYEAAIDQVEAASFAIDETVKTPESSWIKSATFSSCDGNLGFFLLRVKDETYIYQDVPLELWEGFKQTDSKGGFYNREIKGRYKLQRE